MRVLVLSRDIQGLDPSSGTASRWKMLCDQGIELDILVLSRQERTWDEKGIHVQGSGGKNIIKRLWALHRLAQRRSSACDIITAQDPFELGWIAYHVSQQSSKPFEVQDHGGFFDGKPADEPLWPFRLRLARWIASRTDSVRTVSPESLRKLHEMGLGKKTYFLPIAAEPRFASVHREPDPHLIVTVCRLIKVKRIGLLLASLALVRKTRPHTRLAIIGDGSERKPLETMASRLGLMDAVQFVGTADPAPWLARAAVFAFVSAHEGWGIAAVEAALVGVPVVMSDTGCARILSEAGCARVVDDARPQNVSTALLAALDDPGQKLPFGGLIISPSEAAQAQGEAWKHLCVAS
jgi:glycosyltransferase involved in cell wall biosynthesis